MTDRLFQVPFPEWMGERGRLGEVAVSTRVRLGRNLEELPFPNRLTAEELDRLMRSLEQLLEGGLGLRWAPWGSLPIHQKRLALERRLLSAQQALEDVRIVGVTDDENGCFLTNSGDHFAFLGFSGGWNWSLALLRAQGVWRAFEPSFRWARHDRYGWLGADPLYWGPNLRVTVTIHLPALEETGRIVQVLDRIEESRLTLRGLSSLDKRSLGDLYLVATGPTTGRSVLELVRELEDVLREVAALEAAARSALWRDSRIQVLDRIGRSLGILRGAHLLPEQEAFACLSQLRLGVNLGILKGEALSRIDRLYYGILRGHLMFDVAEEDAAEATEERLRAAFVKEILAEGVEGHV